jgi:AcrR family transcriptional regulator
MRAIAERVGIRAPSLYKHFSDKDDLEIAMIAEGFRETARVFAAAIAGDDPLAGLAAAYRGWALQHPHLCRGGGGAAARPPGADQMTPRATIARATRRKPAMLAPFT